ncbi:MAG: hypothetical protein IJQ00_07010 [Kiritimatiellae bacterium]|nr:hypothetical protein [Kiritimatiellia bacterium]
MTDGFSHGTVFRVRVCARRRARKREQARGMAAANGGRGATALPAGAVTRDA